MKKNDVILSLKYCSMKALPPSMVHMTIILPNLHAQSLKSRIILWKSYIPRPIWHLAIYFVFQSCPHALIWHSSFPSRSQNHHRIAAHVFINQAWMVASWQKAENSDMIWLYVFFHLSNQNVEELPYHSHAQHTFSKYGHPENPNGLLRLHHLRLPILQMLSSCSEQKCSTTCSLAPL